MLSKEKLARINQLAKKSKSTGLTTAEAKEQSKLRGEYLQSLRASMRQTIENTRVFDTNGDEVTPMKLRKIQQNKGLH
ncbi:DUF896 domain-containing protein [Siminovitchia acidinfaciens]|uniref:UPF0291 protein D4T97_019075 n=1 Tax=Siminovitchia acidinfaciens TaxID=2321395 RepID=A0A429XTV1_9BACI|nr:DUF896 domain-containing protein [Siminovitchia acidinfaciens]RST71267.1 DUF896 domain-containing protein [Siminovitchia acidinfaciens]VEF48271.1 UPF0291 protein [Bacillus freudenreichii]